MTSTVFKDRPIQLVEIKEDGHFEITSDGLCFLTSLKNQKLAVLSITGPYRSGKSFLANLIMNKMAGFKVGSTINACTKGLWVWGRPIPLDKGRNLLIIDSEGLGSVEKDRTGNIDMKIFTLSVLLSSCIIYNTKYAISEDKIEELSNAANLTKRINISKDNKNNLGLDFGDFFPELVWVLRDFSLDIGNLTSKEYLEQSLKSIDVEEVEGAESKNICREIITKNFRRRDCYTLVVPSTNEAKLRNLDNEPQSSLRPEFINQVEKMISNIKSSILPKKVRNVELDGESLFGLLRAYVDSINNEEAPVILSALESVLLSKAKTISENVFEIFKNSIHRKVDDKLPLNSVDIYSMFFEGQNDLIGNFCKEINDTISSEQIGNYILKLFGDMKDELEILMESNTTAYDEMMENEVSNISESIQQRQFNNLEQTKLYFSNLINDINLALNKICELSKSEFAKKLITAISSLLQIKLFDTLKTIGGNIEELYASTINKYSSQIEDLNLKNKQLNDYLAREKKITELKEKEVSETKVKIYELESKNDMAKKKFKEKEMEYMNNLKHQIQKYQKMEASYISLIQEKDDKYSSLNAKMNQLSTKDLMKKDNSFQKDNSYPDTLIVTTPSESYDSKSLTLQSLFKNFQENVLQFKEDVNKLSQDKESIFKERYIQKCKQEIDMKTRNWGDEIISMIKKQIEAISQTYEENKKSMQEEIRSLNDEIEKLQNENTLNQKYKIYYDGAKKQIEEYLNITKSKDSIIETQLKDLKFKADKIKEISIQKENIEIKLSEFITKYKLKEEENEEIFLTFEGILEKKKDKFKHHLENLSWETQERFTQYNKKYKLKLN